MGLRAEGVGQVRGRSHTWAQFLEYKRDNETFGWEGALLAFSEARLCNEEQQANLLSSGYCKSFLN